MSGSDVLYAALVAVSGYTALCMSTVLHLCSMLYDLMLQLHYASLLTCMHAARRLLHPG